MIIRLLFVCFELKKDVRRETGTELLRALFQLPPFKIPSFMFVLHVIMAKRVMLRCKV